MTSLTDLREAVDVIIGVDTHVHTHSAAALDARTGGVPAQITVPATAAGYTELVEFADAHAGLRAWTIEGTSGARCRPDRGADQTKELIIELDRPQRPQRRHGAKSDPLDAVRAAREALARPRLGTPRSGGDRQALSVRLAARRSAVQATGDAQRQIHGLVIAAPETLRTRFAGQSTPAMLKNRHRPTHPQAPGTPKPSTPLTVLRTLARRARALAEEAAEHEQAILTIIAALATRPPEELGIGPIVAATVLCAWSHPGRIHSEAAFAMLAGAAPIPATSGQTTNRHRLNRYGDRQLNRVLHTIVLTRLRLHEPTRAYVARRTVEGKTPREIKRCLRRYIARDLYRLLERPPTLDRT